MDVVSLKRRCEARVTWRGPSCAPVPISSAPLVARAESSIFLYFFFSSLCARGVASGKKRASDDKRGGPRTIVV